MAPVTEFLLEMLRKQVEAHGTVVWYDPKGAYKSLAESLLPEAVGGASIYRYDPQKGFFWLRRELEPLWGGTEPPRLLLYVPLEQAETKHALIEFEVGGVVMQPRAQRPERNTALAAVARQALKDVFPPAALEEILGQVEAGQLSLAELDDLAERRLETNLGVVTAIFGTGNVSEVALRFLSDSTLDAEIAGRQALPNLSRLFSEAFGVPFSEEQGLEGLRTQLARLVLVTDLIAALGESLPAALKTFPLAAQEVARKAAVELAQAWRNRRDLATSYIRWADRVQTEIGLGSLGLDLEALARTETFAAGEALLQEAVEAALVSRATAALLARVESRMEGFWATQKPEFRARWKVIADAGRVLLESARVEAALKGKSWAATALLARYAGGDQPWCELDTAQRHLERDFHCFELDLQQHDSLLRLVSLARQRYAAVSDALAERFVRAYAEAGFAIPEVRQQADIYHQIVAPALEEGPVGYILVDALRFEMARELLAVLEAGWTAELSPALATPPAVTEIGMAALLPGAESGIAIVAAGDNGLAAVIAGKTLKTRQDRLDHLRAAVGGKVVVAQLDQLAPLSDTHLCQEIKSAALVVVTATEEIDGLCENTPSVARRMLDDVLNQLRRGIKTLFGLGVRIVIVTSDHGYLFGEKLTAGQGIDAPGGRTVMLKRRVWLGQGGANLPGVLRASLANLGLGGELELATPANLSCFKVKGGATEYFHGGMSLQEVVIPVLVVRSGAAPLPPTGTPIEWKLTLGSAAISTRFVSVTVEGETRELLPIEPPTVRVEVRAGSQTISVPVAATYGFQETTRDVQLQPDPECPQKIAKNTVTLAITEESKVDKVTVHLLDAATGIGLARLDNVPLAIAL